MKQTCQNKTVGKPLWFDRKDILSKAMEVFWTYGYAGTSIDLLEQNLWISRSSITNTFKNKRGLYNESLAIYRELIAEKLLIPLHHKNISAKERLKEFFNNVFILNSWKYCWKGCLIINTAGEFWGKDKDIKNLIKENINILENEFTIILEDGKKDMSLQNIPQNTPQILVSFFINLHTISKTVGDEKILKKYLEAIISMIDEWQ